MPKKTRYSRQRNVEFDPLPKGPFDVILADPPWEYRNFSDSINGASVSVYDVLRTEDICALPVEASAADNCALCLWATFPKIQEALRVIAAWGFEYVGVLFDWTKTYREPVRVPLTDRAKYALAQIVEHEDWTEFVKPNKVENVVLLTGEDEGIEVPFDNRMFQFIPEQHWHKFSGQPHVTIVPGNEYCGIGFYTRKNNEVCLLGKKGKITVANRSILSSILSKRRKHSQKPDCQYERIERLWPNRKYLELFARKRYNANWQTWGFQAPKEENEIDNSEA